LPSRCRLGFVSGSFNTYHMLTRCLLHSATSPPTLLLPDLPNLSSASPSRQPVPIHRLRSGFRIDVEGESKHTPARPAFPGHRRRWPRRREGTAGEVEVRVAGSLNGLTRDAGKSRYGWRGGGGQVWAPRGHFPFSSLFSFSASFSDVIYLSLSLRPAVPSLCYGS
jgi:hypothetical protein